MKLKYAKKQLTPTKSLAKQVSWLPEKLQSFPKSKNSSLKIALIASERLNRSLQVEGQVFVVSEENWRSVLKYGEPDLLLIESCSQTVTGDWFMAQTSPDLQGSELGKMIEYARSLNIPIAYWFTLDLHYLYAYEPMISLIGSVYCADDRAVDALKTRNVNASLLLPAVQPALFTKLNEYSQDNKELLRVVCDDLVGLIQSWSDKQPFYKELQSFGGVFFDSMNQIWTVRTKAVDLPDDVVLGTIDFMGKVALFKHARTLGVLKSQSRTRTELQWSMVEAAASYMTVLLEPGVDPGLLAEFCLQPGTQDQFFVELIKQDKDDLYYERVAHKNWRAALQKHTFSHRLQQICNDLKIEHDWVEFPRAAMVTPSYRKKFLQRAKDNFNYQSYPNKHWSLVFNGPFEDFTEVKREVDTLPNARAIYVPEELHAGPCMNAGINAAEVEYVFRVDDDDYYGPNYLWDMMLYAKVVDFDAIGKVFKYWASKDFNEGSVFIRNNQNFDFSKPAILYSKNLPEKFSFLAGCSQGMRKSFFLGNPYPMRSFGTVDSQWLDGLREKGECIILSVDTFNMVVDRRLAGDHTWQVNLEFMKKDSREFNLDMNKVSFL